MGCSVPAQRELLNGCAANNGVEVAGEFVEVETARPAALPLAK